MQVPLASILHYDIDVTVIVEKLKQFYDVRVVQLTQNRHLGTGLFGTVFLHGNFLTFMEVMCIFFIA
jgi:hypothetical protein